MNGCGANGEIRPQNPHLSDASRVAATVFIALAGIYIRPSLSHTSANELASVSNFLL